MNKYDEYNSYSEKILLEIHDYLEKRQFEHYGHISTLCHPVLSKNPYSSKFLDHYLKNEEPKFSLLLILINSLIFIKNFMKGFAYESVMILISGKSKPSAKDLEIITLSFFNYDKLEQSLFDELYFPGMQAELNKENRSFTYFPKLYNTPRNAFKAKAILSNIKKRNPHYLSPYELIKRRDIFELAFITLMHFFQNLKTLRPFSKNKFDLYFNQAVIENLSGSFAYMFMYYIASKRLVELADKSKVILWYENQIVDKCVIKGLRTKKSIEIYGAQFFLIIPQEMNLFPSAYEIKNNLCPDYILTTQKFTLFNNAPERYLPGIAMRYLYIGKNSLPLSFIPPENSCALLLTAFEERNQEIFRLLLNAKLDSYIFNVKKHPGRMQTQIPAQKNWYEVNSRPEEMLINNSIIFSADSGIIFEAMALGKQVIILGSSTSPSYYIPPVLYMNKLWTHVTEAKDIETAIGKLNEFKRSNPEEIISLAKKVRTDYFNSSEKNLLEIFNIR